MIPFIRKQYPDDNYDFGSDFASAHAKNVIALLDSESINYVLKKDNPANYSEIKPIEDFWGYLIGLFYKGKWEAENVQS